MDLPVKYDEISWQERAQARLQYINEQKGLCFWCNHKLDRDPPDSIMNKEIDETLFPPTMFKYPIHLQHDRQTGLTEGAVHARCNAVMWQYHGR